MVYSVNKKSIFHKIKKLANYIPHFCLSLKKFN